MFVILAVVILGSAIMCVATKRIMRAFFKQKTAYEITR